MCPIFRFKGIVYFQLLNHIVANKLNGQFQSAHKPGYNTEMQPA